MGVMDEYGYAQCKGCHGEFRKETMNHGKCPFCNQADAKKQNRSRKRPVAGFITIGPDGNWINKEA